MLEEEEITSFCGDVESECVAFSELFSEEKSAEPLSETEEFEASSPLDESSQLSKAELSCSLLEAVELLVAKESVLLTSKAEKGIELHSIINAKEDATMRLQYNFFKPSPPLQNPNKWIEKNIDLSNYIKIRFYFQ